MTGKAQRTASYIVETVAPIFCKYGYVGTSMSHLTEATGLTKGAIYGNFENKLALALAALQNHKELLFAQIDPILQSPEPSRRRLKNLLDFYRRYNEFTEPIGGCPIVNMGIDAQNNNATIASAVKEMLRELEGKLAAVIEEGVQNGEYTVKVPAIQFAKQFMTLIQGAITNYSLTADHKYLINTTNYIAVLLDSELPELEGDMSL